MKRGDIWWADLGGRAGKRPVVILTRSNVIPHRNKVTVAEITTQGKGYSTEVDIDQQANLPQQSFVQLDSIQTIAKTRLERLIGTLDDNAMKAIGQKVVLALNLEDVFTSP
jgi:mRNA-degrading endonuclease toxin of MazEF toxin-antitoxin module